MTEDFSPEVLDKALVAAREIRNLFKEPYIGYPPEDGADILPREKWNDYLYSYVQDGLYEVIGSFTSPDGRPYAAAYILSEEEIRAMQAEQILQDNISEHQASAPLRTLRDFKNLNSYCLDCIGGIALIDHRHLNEPPGASLTFGAVWSSIYYQHPAGCANIRDDFKHAYEIAPYDPFYATVSDSDEVVWGEPSEEFLPMIIRNLLRKEAQAALPDANPKFWLVKRERYAMPSAIVLETQSDAPPEKKDALAGSLTWLMPPYLPLSVI